MTKPQESLGRVMDWDYPKYKVSRFEYTMEFHIKKEDIS